MLFGRTYGAFVHISWSYPVNVCGTTYLIGALIGTGKGKILEYSEKYRPMETEMEERIRAASTSRVFPEPFAESKFLSLQNRLV